MKNLLTEEVKLNKKLYKDKSIAVLSGVLGGMAESLGYDPSLFRVGYVILAIVTGGLPALIGYIILGIVLPDKSSMES